MSVTRIRNAFATGMVDTDVASRILFFNVFIDFNPYSFANDCTEAKSLESTSMNDGDPFLLFLTAAIAFFSFFSILTIRLCKSK